MRRYRLRLRPVCGLQAIAMWTGALGSPALCRARVPAIVGAGVTGGDAIYLTDPTIAEALRARDTATAHQRAKACIDAAFDRGDAIDVEQAIAEFRTLVASAGLAIRASDDTVAGWLGLI